MGLPKAILSKIEHIVGPKGVLAFDTDPGSYSLDATSHWQSMSVVVAVPTTTEHVADIMCLALEESNTI